MLTFYWASTRTPFYYEWLWFLAYCRFLFLCSRDYPSHGFHYSVPAISSVIARYYPDDIFGQLNVIWVIYTVLSPQSVVRLYRFSCILIPFVHRVFGRYFLILDGRHIPNKVGEVEWGVVIRLLVHDRRIYWIMLLSSRSFLLTYPCMFLLINAHPFLWW